MNLCEYKKLILSLRLAEEVHKNQIYRGYGGRKDEPYILHPIRVSFAVTDMCKSVAMLHDVFEDSDIEFPAWLSAEEKLALDALTHDKLNDSYRDYIDRVFESGYLAVEVKIADLRDNLSNHPPKPLRQRYEKALFRLTK